MTDESPASGPASIGRYQVIRTLGEGGMGAVFLATDPAIDRQVALKLMRAGFNSGSLRERFAREARAVGRLHHPNIVTIFEFGEHQGEPFIAMEYVEGETLSSLIGRPDVSLSQLVGLMYGLCAGLHYAHRAGIIHRDIKPVNVMVDTEGIVKILDFGIARAAALSLTQSGTQPGTVLGTLNYMSPEQLSGKAIDQRTDIFAVGAVFYELLAGRQAFPGDIDSGILQLILMTGPAPLAGLRPDLDPALVAIVNRCLERDVERRYPDLGVMRKDLAAFQRADAAPRSAGATVLLTPGGSPSAIVPVDIRTPGPDTRAAVESARRAQLDAQVTDARAALDREEYTRATEACQHVLSVEPSHSGALALQAQLNTVLQARAWLADGQAEFNRGALTSATALVDRALGVRPAMPEGLRLRAAIEEARVRTLQSSPSAPTMLVTPDGTSGTPAVDAGATIVLQRDPPLSVPAKASTSPALAPIPAGTPGVAETPASAPHAGGRPSFRWVAIAAALVAVVGIGTFVGTRLLVRQAP
ncbi:MAG TPA: protein kinase, partial [Vicinamibacterales bacterium]